MNAKVREEMMKRLLLVENEKDYFGGSAMAKLLYAPELWHDAEAHLEQVANWFLLPHPTGNDHQGEPDFVAQKLIRALFLLRGRLSDRTRAAIDRFFCEWDFESMYKSENHMLMFHSARYLYCKLNPDAYLKQYQKTAGEIVQEDRSFLRDFIEFRAKRGYAEFDSLGYGAECFVILLNLIDFAEADMSRYAEMAANLMLMDMIADCSKDGLYGGAHGRVYEGQVKDFKNAPMCALYQLYFGDEVFNWNCIEAISSAFVPADYVYAMLMSRPDTWENYECKHLHSITYELPHKQVPQVEGSINKYTYVTPNYIMGAVNWQDPYPEGSPAAWYAHHQQHEWELTLCHHTDLRIFTHHPGRFGHEKKEHGYWTGDMGCRCGQFYSRKNRALAIYDIPEGEPDMIHAHVPLELVDIETEEHTIWIKTSEDVFAYLWFSNGFTGGSEAYKERELRSFGRKHGVVCVAGTKKEYRSYEQFKSEMKKNTPVFDEADMRLAFMGMEMTKSTRCFMGKAEAFPYDTYRSPMMYSARGSGIIETASVKLTFEGFGCITHI